MHGQEIPKVVVDHISNANEELMDAVVQGSQPQPPRQTRHHRNLTQPVSERADMKATGSFFTSEPLQHEQHQILAIEENASNSIHAGQIDAANREKNNSSTFFVTLQDAAKKHLEEQ